MSLEFPVGFNPELYVKPEIYENVLSGPGVVAIGEPVDAGTFEIIRDIGEKIGKRVGMMALLRKEAGSGSEPQVDYFPVYSDAVLSIVGSYTFEAGFDVKPEHVEEAEELIFTSPMFEALTDEQRRRNVIRIAPNAARSDLSKREGVAIIPLIGGAVVVTTTLHEGVSVRSYQLTKEGDDRGQA